MAESVGFLVVSEMKYSIESYVEIAFQILSSEVMPLFKVFAILAITILGICLVLGKFQDSSKEILSIIIITPVAIEFASNYGLFSSFFVEPMVESTKSLMGIFVSLTTTSGDPLESMFLTMDSKFALVFQSVSVAVGDAGFFSEAAMWFVTFFLAVLYGFLYIVFTTLVIYGLFAFYVYAVLAPVAIMFGTMSKTRFIFWAWFRQVCNYLLVPVITSIIMGITVHVLDMSANIIADMNIEEDGVFNKQIGITYLIGFVSLFFHLKAPELANGLSGGQASGVGGFFGGMGAMAAGTKMVLNQTGISKGSTAITNGLTRAAGKGLNSAGDRFGGRAYSAAKGVVNYMSKDK
jgi:hypothetical protein